MRHFELVERGSKMVDRLVPLCFSNSKAFMRCLHGLSDVYAGSAGRLADLIHDELANSLQGCGTMTCKEFSQVRIRRKPGDEIIDHCCNCIVAAEALIERFFLLLLSIGGCGTQLHDEAASQH